MFLVYMQEYPYESGIFVQARTGVKKIAADELRGNRTRKVPALPGF